MPKKIVFADESGTYDLDAEGMLVKHGMWDGNINLVSGDEIEQFSVWLAERVADLKARKAVEGTDGLDV